MWVGGRRGKEKGGVGRRSEKVREHKRRSDF